MGSGVPFRDSELDCGKLDRKESPSRSTFAKVKTRDSMERLEILRRSALANCLCCCVMALALSPARSVHAWENPQLKTASNQPIQYYLSLPESWTARKRWPVVVVIESADREFLEAATVFAQARQHRPFILITPLVVTNGGSGYRSVPTYHYSDAVWEQIQNSGPFNFDLGGLSAIMQDVVKQYAGEDKYFITGFEAGGHTVWGILFNHPEVTRGAVLVCPNYQGRWVDETHISSAVERSRLPIRNFVGTRDELCSPGHPIYTQMQKAVSLAEAHGYQNVSLTRVEGARTPRRRGACVFFIAAAEVTSGDRETLTGAQASRLQ
jgi:hypothetical protein